MPLSRLIINDFRNITTCDIQLSPGFNFVIGPNGSGKTSVLEAIYLLGHGRSFKSSLTGRIIRNDCDELFIHGRFTTPELFELPIGINKQRDGTTEVKIGGESGQKLAQLAKVLPLQLIHPEGFELVTDGPKFRRAFIDWGVFHVEPAFYDAWSRVKRLTKQRNALLKTANSYRELSYWDLELAQLSEKIDQWRVDYINHISEATQQICQAFLPEYDIKLSYYRGWDRETPYAELLKKNFERDKQLGYTVGGPNKADLRIKVAGTPVEDVLSRGQLKLMVCALRLAQGQHLTEATGKQCIYLIDDFASELDSHRRQLLAQYLKQTKAQVFISSITAEQIADMHDDESKMFEIEHGKIAQG
ncbi:DNA replication/repair protein RecF [Aliivibrio fischeri]|uniref:DNA replication and repair protein RecF n=1 Tax=Aliivibrio fischeri (strain MJ11) TaxID=388396 RepID=RECF_ALIFM|nr:DNA replication/repair protein RecF [Aliivibrio fischeri]B5FEV5.1 RecName: Full=DNA replication and repair protein RecF [Aliivibrio fischeri MJ11]ACH64942.1 DNA replication and repair protein RecF [Aliivibrio fischeri MJ11]MCE4935666.1 DNA replication/repair protein RecF [Aliivibrio fischeri]MUJ26579.1 DNA replication/repair protein RecF [Aliivibrio fischeri]OCH09821.1 DNA replication/repair protein RecF [Aliivibrio fischeri]OCH28817.1 DNA replication/repair protein RecF [Aliivibrio fische